MASIFGTIILIHNKGKERHELRELYEVLWDEKDKYIGLVFDWT